MYRVLSVVLLTVLASVATAAEKEKSPSAPKALSFKMKNLEGKEVQLKKYSGKVVLVVNVASKCGLTDSNYKGLQKIYDKYQDKGLAILGFPCNQFGRQEPGSSKEISKFCTKNYGVTFDVFEKVDVNGDEACGLYKHLTELDAKPKGPGEVTWNFEKFLIDRSGNVVGRFAPNVKPTDNKLVTSIEKELENQVAKSKN